MGRHEQLCVHAGLVVFHVFFQYRGTLFFQSPPFAKMQDNTRHFRLIWAYVVRNCYLDMHSDAPDSIYRQILEWGTPKVTRNRMN